MLADLPSGVSFDAAMAMREAGVDSDVSAVPLAPATWSDLCAWDELAVLLGGLDRVRGELDVRFDWSRRWRASWRYGGDTVSSPVRDLGAMPSAGCEPVRRFSWVRRQLRLSMKWDFMASILMMSTLLPPAGIDDDLTSYFLRHIACLRACRDPVASSGGQGVGESFELAGASPVGGSAGPMGVEADQVHGDGGEYVLYMGLGAGDCVDSATPR